MLFQSEGRGYLRNSLNIQMKEIFGLFGTIPWREQNYAPAYRGVVLALQN